MFVPRHNTVVLPVGRVARPTRFGPAMAAAHELSTSTANTRNALIDLVARIPRAVTAQEILRSLRTRVPGYRSLSPELAEREVLEACRDALRLWTKWLVTGELVPANDLAEVRA